MRQLAIMGALTVLSFGAFSPLPVFADTSSSTPSIRQDVQDTVTTDAAQSSGGWTQTLGNGIGGTLLRIEFPVSLTRSPYYGPVFIFDLIACNDPAYSQCSNAVGSGGLTVLPYSGQGSANYVVSHNYTLNDNIHFDPTKYYKISLSLSSNGGGSFREVGSQADAYPNGSTNAGGLSDMAFVLTGVSASTPSTGRTVLFFPGIEGSRLYETNNGQETKIWEPNPLTSANDLMLDENGKSVRQDTYTRDVLDSAYGADIYKSFLQNLQEQKDTHAIADWEAVPYDWRISLNDLLTYGNQTANGISYNQSTSTPYIIQEVRRLAAESSTHKVTIAAHSNGGLVAKELIRVLGAEAPNLIDNVIFVAVPQIGTPQAVAGLLHGQDAGLPSFFPVIFSASSARKVGDNSPTMYNLLPSTAYFNKVNTPVVTIDPVTMPDWVSKYGTSVTNEEELTTFLTDTYQRVNSDSQDLATPTALNATLLSNAQSAHVELDSWTPPSGINLIQIAGWGVAKTLGTVEYHRKGQVVSENSNSVVDGDGTVTVPSALATTGQNVSSYYFDISAYNRDTLNVVQRSLQLWNKDHATILSIPELEYFINDRLIGNQKPLTDYKYFSTNAPNSTSKRLVYTLHSPLSLNLYDNEGRHTGISTTTGRIEEEIPGTYYTEIGETKYIFADEIASQHIRMQGNARGSFTLNVDEFEGDERTASTTFKDIPTTASTSVAISLNSDLTTITNLDVDEDGNGTTDYSLSPRWNGEVTVPKPKLTIHSQDATVLLDSSIPPLTGTLDGFETGDVASTTVRGEPECSTTATSTDSVGSYPIYCSIGTLSSDKYDFATATPGTFTIEYRWDGFLQPVRDREKNNLSKAGSTIPVKFQLKTNTGDPVQAVQSPQWLKPILAASSSESSVSTDTFRWDSVSQQYIYNWSTKGLVAGLYQIGFRSDDNLIHSTTVGLK